MNKMEFKSELLLEVLVPLLEAQRVVSSPARILAALGKGSRCWEGHRQLEERELGHLLLVEEHQKPEGQ